MERVEQYKTIVRDILNRHVEFEKGQDEVRTVPIFDNEHGRYQLVRHGWYGEQRVFGILVHVEVREGKVWIERDGIETGIAQELMTRGIPKTHIVLGFRSPYMRQFMDFAVA